MKRFFLLLILWCATRNLEASFDTKKGARPLGMGGAYTAISSIPEAIHYNPAGLWQISHLVVSGFYSAPYNLKELQTTTFNLAIPIGLGVGGAAFESYGYDLYRESTVSLAWSGSFRDLLSFGTVANYHHLAIQDGGSASTVTLDAGVLMRPLENLTAGFSVRNINGGSIKKDELPQSASLGLNYRVLQNWSVSCDVYKDVRFPSDWRLGSEYIIANRFMVRGGLASEPSRFAGGLGFDFGLGQIDYAFYTHRDLGLTHAVSLTYFFKRKPPRSLKSPV